MSFSKRIGLIPSSKSIQIDSMDSDLKNSLWNALYKDVFEYVKPTTYYDDNYQMLREDILINYFKTSLNKSPERYHTLVEWVEKYFTASNWNIVYDLVDFFIGKEYIDSDAYVSNLNLYLEREYSGYRIINNMVVPISNEIEVDSLNESLSVKFTGFDGVNIHLNNALVNLSDRIVPNYSNSIKESISAVESITRILTDEGSLGSALNKLEKKGIEINNQLKESFTKVYAYSNDKSSGIRHAILEGHTPPNFETAKYILITSSAFINYLVGISQKANLL